MYEDIWYIYLYIIISLKSNKKTSCTNTLTEDSDVNGGGQTVLDEGQRGELIDIGLTERQTVSTDIEWGTDRLAQIDTIRSTLQEGNVVSWEVTLCLYRCSCVCV